jgi:peroxiredoxin Q/BCP
MLNVGDRAPDFTGVDQNGKTIRLSELKGSKVVLYFYPKDMTPGCTVEACSFRDGQAAVKKKGAVVLGVSKDSAASHKKFAEKYSLPFSLIADESGEIVKAYGAWGKSPCMERNTWAFSASRMSSAPMGAWRPSSRK